LSHTWFRMYNEVVDDPKVQKLHPSLFRAWVNCLCIAAKNGGALPPIDSVAYSLHLNEKKASSLIDALIAERLLDREGDRIIPHNWGGRQFQSDNSTPRVKRFRNGQRNVSETASETDQIQNRTDTEQKQNPPTPFSASISKTEITSPGNLKIKHIHSDKCKDFGFCPEAIL